MSKYRFLLLILLWSGVTSDLFSQEQEKKSIEKWGIGVDVLSLFELNDYPRFSIFGIREIGEMGWAARARVGIEGNSHTNQFAIPPRNDLYLSPDIRKGHQYFILLGVQKDALNFTDNSSLYTGLDVFYKGDKLVMEYVEGFDSPDHYYVNKVETEKKWV